MAEVQSKLRVSKEQIGKLEKDVLRAVTSHNIDMESLTNKLKHISTIAEEAKKALFMEKKESGRLLQMLIDEQNRKLQQAAADQNSLRIPSPQSGPPLWRVSSWAELNRAPLSPPLTSLILTMERIQTTLLTPLKLWTLVYKVVSYAAYA